MAEAHNVGVSGAGGMTHPTEGRGVVSFHEENPAVGLWEVGRGERVVKGKRAHHEEGIYDDADELVDVDVVLGASGSFRNPVGEGFENRV